MKKGITINDKHSYNDFGLEIGTRDIGLPSLNKITESVPYQNGVYDFSDLNGEVTYANRTIKYSFDIGEISTELMENKKRDILSWLSDLTNVNIYDDYDPDYYFYGSLESYSWTEDFGKATLTVSFSAYPYKFSIDEQVVEFEVDEELETILITNSAHNILPTIISTAEMLIERDNTSWAINAGTYNDASFVLYKENNFKFTGTGTIIFKYVDEVL